MFLLYSVEKFRVNYFPSGVDGLFLVCVGYLLRIGLADENLSCDVFLLLQRALCCCVLLDMVVFWTRKGKNKSLRNGKRIKPKISMKRWKSAIDEIGCLCGQNVGKKKRPHMGPKTIREDYSAVTATVTNSLFFEGMDEVVVVVVGGGGGVGGGFWCWWYCGGGVVVVVVVVMVVYHPLPNIHTQIHTHTHTRKYTVGNWLRRGENGSGSVR